MNNPSAELHQVSVELRNLVDQIKHLPLSEMDKHLRKMHKQCDRLMEISIFIKGIKYE